MLTDLNELSSDWILIHDAVHGAQVGWNLRVRQSQQQPHVCQPVLHCFSLPLLLVCLTVSSIILPECLSCTRMDTTAFEWQQPCTAAPQ